jgi:hypothetical protein
MLARAAAQMFDEFVDGSALLEAFLAGFLKCETNIG